MSFIPSEADKARNEETEIWMKEIAVAVAAEREACASVADNYGAPEIAQIIRARGGE